MQKLSQKVNTQMDEYDAFQRELNCIVWSQVITAEEFETRWKILIERFGLEKQKWLTDMFKNRKSWINAYYRDTLLYGLVKTTSISESMNSFFRKYSSCNSNLIEFMIFFDSAMEAQRHKQGKNDSDSVQRIRPLISKL